jgi:hypothetical protein
MMRKEAGTLTGLSSQSGRAQTFHLWLCTWKQAVVVLVTRKVTRALRQLRLLREVEARLGGAAGQPRPRQRARGVAARTLRRAGRQRDLGRRRRLGAEDVFLALPFEQRLELLALERLALDEDLGDRLERRAVLAEDVLRGLMGALDDAADLVVDLARDLVGVVGLGAELAAEERCSR